MTENVKIDIIKIMSTKSKLKAFITLNDLYIKDLAVMMTEKCGKKYTPDGLAGKIRRETLTFKEAELLADLLGYNLEFVKK